MNEEREWEVWNEELVDDIEIKYWGGIDHKRGRHWELNKWVSEYVKKGDSVLEIAPGMGHFYDMIKDSCGSYLGLDTSSAMVKKFKGFFPEANVRIGDAFNLKDEPNADIVINVDMLMHIPEPEGDYTQTIQLIKNMLEKADRELVFTIRMSEEGQESWCITKAYYDGTLTIRAYSKEDMLKILKQAKGEDDTVKYRFYDPRTSIWRIIKNA